MDIVKHPESRQLARTVKASAYVFEDQNSKRLMSYIAQIAPSEASVLIIGETGTGKDLLAKACHFASLRREKKFIAVNCAGLPDEDAESEMFGRKVGDSETIGFFEYANEGTVLLDGIAELSLSLQAKLLRFLTDGSFRRVGEEKEHHANVRVICTSQEPMEKLLEQGKLRSDLFHRLNVLALNVPPLRERVEDIQPLTEGFLQEISTQLKISMPQYNADFLLP